MVLSFSGASWGVVVTGSYGVVVKNIKSQLATSFNITEDQVEIMSVTVASLHAVVVLRDMPQRRTNATVTQQTLQLPFSTLIDYYNFATSKSDATLVNVSSELYVLPLTPSLPSSAAEATTHVFILFLIALFAIASAA